MKNLWIVLLIFSAWKGNCQQPLELAPGGFESVTFEKPEITSDKFIESVRSWAASFYENNSYGFDIYDVSDATISIDGSKENAFFYRNRGEEFFHRIKYTIKVELLSNSYRVKFYVREIYTRKNLLELTPADFFNSEGKLKEDYLDAKPSLEKSVNSIVNSLADYIDSTN